MVKSEIKNQFLSFDLRTPPIFVTTKIHESISNFYSKIQLGFLHPLHNPTPFFKLDFSKTNFFNNGSNLLTFVPVLLTALSTHIKTLNFQLF